MSSKKKQASMSKSGSALGGKPNFNWLGKSSESPGQKETSLARLTTAAPVTKSSWSIVSRQGPLVTVRFHLNTAIVGRMTITAFAANRYIVGPDNLPYYAYPLSPADSRIWPTGLYNEIIRYSKARISKIRLHTIPEVGTGAVVVGASSFNPGELACAIVYNRDLPIPADSTETSVPQLTLENISAYQTGFCTAPGIPANGAEWSRHPLDGEWQVTAGYDPVYADAPAAYNRTSSDLSITCTGTQATGLDGVGLVRFAISGELQLLYPREMNYTIVGPLSALSPVAKCVMCGGSKNFCFACGGKSGKTYIPLKDLNQSAVLRYLQLADSKDSKISDTDSRQVSSSGSGLKTDDFVVVPQSAAAGTPATAAARVEIARPVGDAISRLQRSLSVSTSYFPSK